MNKEYECLLYKGTRVLDNVKVTDSYVQEDTGKPYKSKKQPLHFGHQPCKTTPICDTT